MTDREMLELAAKAAGYDVRSDGEGGLVIPTRRGACRDWDPINNDGDALRLAVKLKIDLLFNDTGVETWSANNWFYGEDFGDDPLSAARRAIVRAAAQIGAQM